MEAVSDLTKYDFGRVYEMTALEFFAMVSYCKYKMKKEEEQIKRFKNQRNAR